MPSLRILRILTSFKIAFPATLILLLALSLLSIYSIFHFGDQTKTLNQSLSSKADQIASLSTRVNNLLAENDSLRSGDAQAELTTIHNTIEKYETVKAKSDQYKKDGVNVSAVEPQFPTAVDLILQQKYTDADLLLTKLDSDLETSLKAKQAADAAAAAKSKTNYSSTNCSVVPASGYCRLYISASSGTFLTDIVAAPLSSIRVITDTANSSDCTNNCPTKSLASYVSSNGGFAGMNGTYFCPPDYASCSGLVGSYNSPVYNTNLAKWLNQGHLAWTGYAMLAFTSSSAVFYPQVNAYSGLGGLRAAISNYPGLVQNGANIIGNYSLTSAQLTRGTRGGIATKGNTVYLIVTRSASVPDLANIMIAMGVTNGLNLDGGGSSALYYNGSYKVGPGRSLPNAVIFK